MFSRITRKNKTEPAAGISVLERAPQLPARKKKKGPAATAGHRPGILSTLGPFLLYILFLVFLAGALLVLDGPPRWPEYGWRELGEKLTGPAGAFPWQYLVASIGWVVVGYLALILVVQLAVNLLYLASARRHRGVAGPLASRLRRVAGSLTLSPAQRVVEGLLAGLAFFTFATSVAGAPPATGGQAPGGLDQATPDDPYSPAMVESFNAASWHTQPYSQAKAAQLNQLLNPPDTGPVVLNAPSVVTYQSETTTLQYRVEPGDSLWSIAEQFYGDGQRYLEIYQANLGQPVGGGEHFGQAGLIKPGWVITIPGTAGGLTPVSLTTGISETAQSQGEYTVKEGDCLWDIAGRELADPGLWPRIWELNAGHTMEDGRVFSDPNLIQPGWKLQMPQTGPAARETPPDQGETPPGTASQSPAPAATEQPVAPPVHPGDTPAQTGTAVTIPATQPAATSTPNPVPTVTPVPAATRSPVPTAATPPAALSAATTHQPRSGEWPWLMALGLGGTGAVSFGGLKLARALAGRRRAGEIKPRFRFWWQRNQAVNRWARHSGFLLESVPQLPVDPRTGEVTGFATTGRPLELLRLKVHGSLDADKPALVLARLLALFESQGLPRLLPLSCMEGSSGLAFLFGGNPQEMLAYLEADGAGELEDLQAHLNSGEEAESGKVVAFPAAAGLSNRNPSSDPGSSRPVLNEQISVLFGGVAWVERQRDGLLVTLEDIEFNDTFTPLPGKLVGTGEQSGNIHSQSRPEIRPVRPDPLDEPGFTGEQEDPYSLYIPGEEDSGREVSVRGVAPEDLTGRDLEEGEGLIFPEEPEETPDFLPEPQYLFFPLGATAPQALRSPDPEYPGEAEPKHYHLCLENSGHLLLVAQEGEEEALAVLYNAVLQLAAAAGPAELSLYLVDRPEELGEERIEELVAGLGLEGEAAEQLAGEIAQNRRLFGLLATGLPQVAGLVAGDKQGGLLWRRGLATLIHQVYRELVERRSGSEARLPRVALVISELAVAAALEGEKLAQLLREGPAHGIYVLAATSYEGLVKEVTLPAVLEGEGNSYQIDQCQKLFRSLGVFATGDADDSTGVWGTTAAAGLAGLGEMWLRIAGKSAVRLWGFSLGEEEVQECAGLLDELYREAGGSEISGSDNFNSSRQENAAPYIDFEEETATTGTKTLEPAGVTGGLFEELSSEGSLTAAPDTPGNSVTRSKRSRKNAGGEKAPGLENELSPLPGVMEREQVLLEKQLGQRKPTNSGTDKHNNPTYRPPAAEVAAVLDPGTNQELQKLRRALYRQGLIRPVLSIYLLHGLTVTFCLRPSRSAGSGAKAVFPDRPDMLGVFATMRRLGLSFVGLSGRGALVLKDNSPSPAQVDRYLEELLEKGQTDQEEPSGQAAPEYRQIEEWVQNLLGRFAFGLESANLAGRSGGLSMAELQLLVYLVLKRGGASREVINEELGFSVVDEQRFRKTLEARLRRTREGLKQALEPFLVTVFGELDEELKLLTSELDFFEDFKRFGRLGLEEQNVWADLWELERLRQEGGIVAGSREEEVTVGKLEEAFRLVEVLSTTHHDGKDSGKLRLLGDLGEDERKFGWPVLQQKREEIVEWWYELNFRLGNYYLRQLKTGQPDYLERALNYYRQCHRLRPELEEPALALMEIGHITRNKRLVTQTWRNYQQSCLELEIEPDALVKEEYDRLVKTRQARKSG